MHMDILLFENNEKNRGSHTHNENIQSRYRNGIWHQICAMLIMRSGKRKKKRNQNARGKGKVNDLKTLDVCNMMSEGFRYMPLGLVRLRSFRLSA